MSLFDDIRISDLPSKIEHKNILSAIIELRYTSEKQTELLVWPLYESLKEDFDIPVATDFGKMPREVRQQNKYFSNQILYTMVGKDHTYSIGMGDGIFTINIDNFSYDSWENLEKKFKDVYSFLVSSINKINRIGVRYINVFDEENSSADNFTFEFKIRKETLLPYPIQTIFEMNIDERVARISVANKVNYSYKNEKGDSIEKQNAMVIDIDVIYNKEIEKENVYEVVRNSHMTVKKIFFGICTDKFRKNVLRPLKKEK